ncbi:tail fiber assembly protein [Citrobacter freundii]
MIFRNFTTSIKNKGELQVAFFTDEDGNDWYEKQKELSQDTLKIMFDSSGYIVAASFDASMLSPDGLSVAEISQANIPAEFFMPGSVWSYVDGNIVQICDYHAIALAERDTRLTEATTRINWLAAAQEDGDISDAEETELSGLRAYRSQLRRLDLSAVTDEATYGAIKWPVSPEKTS